MIQRPRFTHDLAVLIGRFQPFHNAHHSLLRKALDAAPRVVVVVGSAFQARSPKNPFSWQERADMIRRALDEVDRARVLFVPMRDHFDEERWIAELRLAVDAALAAHGAASASASATVLVGHVKDASRDYLHRFEGWALHAVERVHSASAATVREALFSSRATEAQEALVRAVPAGTLGFLQSWMATPLHAALAQEWEFLRQHDAAWSVAPYPVVLVTVDCVVKCGEHVLLIRRGHAPGKGLLAVPGGFLELRETTLQSALRELEEETHLDLPPAELLACLASTEVFDRPDRSQRGRTITHGHFFDLGDRHPPAVRADDDAAAAEWTPVSALPSLEDQFLDDHFQMLDHFLGLLPRPFIDA